jgi:ABC-type lipoprotein release transport system permease subunit
MEFVITGAILGIIVSIGGILTGHIATLRVLGIPQPLEPKEYDAWMLYLKECVHDRKLEQLWFKDIEVEEWK